MLVVDAGSHFAYLFLSCLQHASDSHFHSQELIYLDSSVCCQTETEVADQTYYLTGSMYVLVLTPLHQASSRVTATKPISESLVCLSSGLNPGLLHVRLKPSTAKPCRQPVD